jgi:hypothetical protein
MKKATGAISRIQFEFKSGSSLNAWNVKKMTCLCKHYACNRDTRP